MKSSTAEVKGALPSARGPSKSLLAISTDKETLRCRSHAIALDPNLKGRRAAAWLQMWDKSSRSTRLHILEAFLSLHSLSNCDAVTQDLGGAAPLFVTRITSWLRLSYCKLRPVGASTAPPDGLAATNAVCAPASAAAAPAAPAPPPAAAPPAKTPLLAMVECLSIFVRGATYVSQLVESGLAATLTDCLERGSSAAGMKAFQPLNTDEKKAIVLLLLYVANAGRVYREMICDENGLLSLLRVMRVEADEGVASLLTELFVLLGKGNPRLAPFVQCGLFRFIVDHYNREAAREEAQRRTARLGDAGNRAGEGESAVGEDDADDTVVVLQATRALRGLQLHRETHHHSNYRQQGFQKPGNHNGGGGRWSEEFFNSAGVPEVDNVPVVCCFPDCVASGGGGGGGGGGASSMSQDNSHRASPSLSLPTARGGRADGDRFASYACHPAFRPVTTKEFLDSLFGLTLDDNTRFRVEGIELLIMVAKNIDLMPKVLNRALDVLDDDMLVIADADDAAAIARKHRRQLSCGRVAVQVMLTSPATHYRRCTIVDLIALRSAHMSLVKYLRLTDLGDAAAVVDCCRALQLIARASEEAQRSRLHQRQGLASHAAGDDGSGGGEGVEPGRLAPVTAVLKMGQVIRDALGASLYQVLLHDDITEAECFAMLRSARSSATTAAAW